MIDNPYYNAMGSPKRRAQGEYHLTLDYILQLMSEWRIDVGGMRALSMRCGDDELVPAERGAPSLGIDHKCWKVT